MKKQEKPNVIIKIVKYSLLPDLNWYLIFRIAAAMIAWACHVKSIGWVFIAFILGPWYIVAWLLFGESSSAYVIDYWINVFNNF